MNLFSNLPNITGISWLVEALVIVQFAITFLLAIAVRQDAFRRIEIQDDVFLNAPWLWFFVVLLSGGYLATLAYWLIHYSSFRYRRDQG